MILLVTQALDERELLRKRIKQKIETMEYVSYKKGNSANIEDGRNESEFCDYVESEYQSVRDLIRQYDKLDRAIIKSNCMAKVTINGEELSVAEAIALRTRLKTSVIEPTSRCFEWLLFDAMKTVLRKAASIVADENRDLDMQLRNMYSSHLSGEAKVDDFQQLIDAYKADNTAVIVNPIGIENEVKRISDWIENTLKEIDTQIKVSNATTTIEI